MLPARKDKDLEYVLYIACYASSAVVLTVCGFIVKALFF
jgi:hypothetical protein